MVKASGIKASDIVLQKVDLGRPWQTVDPFLFCMHHKDDYPEGDEEFGPCAPLLGRTIGNDFSGLDGWSMYHGSKVPGFPQHPHRGFETVTIAKLGFVDHSDSLGGAARFGRGDVQWMTAGSGITHAEMIPLLNRSEGNPNEWFQIWINLPASDKMVPAHYSMLWGHDIPEHVIMDRSGKPVTVTVIAGEVVRGRPAPPPPPHSWAARPDSDVAIWHAAFVEGASWTLPPARLADTVRTLYVYDSGSLLVAGEEVRTGQGAVLRNDRPVTVTDTGAGARVLVLQGRPIAEPVVQYGPFVMNTQAEIRKAFDDYRTDGFGGWPWGIADPNHGHELRRFARHPDGSHEEFVVA